MVPQEQLVRRDLEGDLLSLAPGQQPGRYAKRLRLDIAWHVADFHDLEGVDTVVATVSEVFERNSLLIEYDPRTTPLDEARLRSLLAVDQPLASWRFGRLAADLSRSLAASHAAGVPQLIVHPERVAALERRFTVLPTFACVLPPLEDWLDGPGEPWLAFLAPEVLRLRAVAPQLLQKGDVYALGRMLALLAAPAAPPAPGTAFERAEALVERADLLPLPALPEALEAYAPIIARMCAFNPDARPSAREAAQELQFLAQQADPGALVAEQIAERRLQVGRAMLAQVEADQAHPGFFYPRSDIHLLYAQVTLAEQPPNYPQAIEHYYKALQFEPQRSEIRLLIARAYLRHNGHPQHRQFAHRNFEEVVTGSGWRAELLAEWLLALRDDPPELLLMMTEEIPWDRRTVEVFTSRAASYVALGDPRSAWSECALFFQRSGYEPRVYAVAETAAQQIEPLWLINWLYNTKGATELHPAAAIVWMCNGNALLAAQHLSFALGVASQQPRGGPDEP